MNRIVGMLTRRLGVLDSRGSALRVGGWVIVWALVLSRLVPIAAPRYTDRPTAPDDPPSAVRYVAPTSRSDFSGFLPPRRDPEHFTLAWIGASEIKLRAVSAPAELSRRVTAVGGKPLDIDAYTMPGLRAIDVYRAVRAAIAADPDAIALSLGPSWTRSEWSLRDWPNLDVADIASLAHTSSLPWLLGLESPGDVTWRVLRAALPLVESQATANVRVEEHIDFLDVLRRPDPLPPATPPPDALPADSTEFWVRHFFGPAALSTTTVRLGDMLRGIGVSSGESDLFMRMTVQALADSGKPVYVYPTPMDPAALSDPTFGPLAEQVEAHWNALVTPFTSAHLAFDGRMITRDLPPVPFVDAVHASDLGPIVNVLARRFCALWAAADPANSCTYTSVEAP